MIWTYKTTVKCSRATILTWTRKKQTEHHKGQQANEEPNMNSFSGRNHDSRQSTKHWSQTLVLCDPRQELHQFAILIRLKLLPTFIFGKHILEAKNRLPRMTQRLPWTSLISMISRAKNRCDRHRKWHFYLFIYLLLGPGLRPGAESLGAV